MRKAAEGGETEEHWCKSKETTAVKCPRHVTVTV